MAETFVRVKDGLLNLRHIQNFTVLDSWVWANAASYYDIEEWDHWTVADCGTEANARAYLDLVSDALADLNRIRTTGPAPPASVIDLRNLP